MTSTSMKRERRRRTRRRARLGFTFRFAGSTRSARTVDVSANSAAIVMEVRLPPSAVIVLQPDDPSLDKRIQGASIRLIARVIWCRTAPFGCSAPFAAGLQLLRASATEWEPLFDFVTQRLRSESGIRARRRVRGQPTLEFTEPAGQEIGRTAVFYLTDGLWVRGDVVSASSESLRVVTHRTPPRLGAPISMRIKLPHDDGLATLIVDGTVLHSPAADESGRSHFECAIGSCNRRELVDVLVHKAPLTKAAGSSS